jgi:hypothetical protein
MFEASVGIHMTSIVPCYIRTIALFTHMAKERRKKETEPKLLLQNMRLIFILAYLW